MEPKKDLQNNRKIQWLKRGVALAAVGIWFILIVVIFKSGGTMADQAPKCIFSTMIVFGILTALHKGIDLWEKRQS